MTADTFDEQERLALVCVDVADRQAAVKAALESLGYTPHVPENAADAGERMRKHPYEVVVVDEEFQGATQADAPVLKAIHGLAMPVRRYIFVALLGRELKTLDNMTAFARSVNAVVNVNDLAQLGPILKRAVRDNDEFYRVFCEVLHEAGKR